MAVLDAIYCRADDRGRYTASLAEVASASRYSVRQVQRCLKELVELGYLGCYPPTFHVVTTAIPAADLARLHDRRLSHLELRR